MPADPRQDDSAAHPARAVPRPVPAASEVVVSPPVEDPPVAATVGAAAPVAALVAAPVVGDPLVAHQAVAAPAGSPATGVGMRDPAGAPDGYRPSCTVAQLRRFIKSRPWIPLHELRRRFGIYGGDDDVSPIRVGGQILFIGLPPAESRLMAELLDGGDVGYELSLDPGAPIVVGVYPMRPVPRG
jgi:hypothetical protein